jgi:hypothetical protein
MFKGRRGRIVGMDGIKQIEAREHKRKGVRKY